MNLDGKRTAIRFTPIILIALFAATTAQADSIQLRARATITDTVARLSDVATLEGDAPAAIAQTIVARFEASQSSIQLTQDALKQQLSRSGVNWARVSLKGFETCEITRETAEKAKPGKRQEAPPAAIDAPSSPIIANPTDEVGIDSQVTLRQRVTDWVRGLHPTDADTLRLTFADRDAKALDALIAGDRLVITTPASATIGRVPVSIQRFRGEKLVDTQRITLDVARRHLAVVAVKPITKGAVVMPSDVEVREVFIDRDNVEVVTQLSDAVGKIASQTLRAGAVFFRDTARPALLVRRNEIVIVQALAGRFTVTTEGRAMEDGAEGDVIQIRNERSRDTFTARVIAAKKVLVSDGGKSK